MFRLGLSWLRSRLMILRNVSIRPLSWTHAEVLVFGSVLLCQEGGDAFSTGEAGSRKVKAFSLGQRNRPSCQSLLPLGRGQSGSPDGMICTGQEQA